MRFLTILFILFFLNGFIQSQTCTVTISNPTPSVCLGTSAVLTASGATTYSWSTGATTASISVSPTATTVYTVTGVAGTCTQVVTTTVTIKALPSVVISPTTPTVCFGNSITLTGSGATTYTWSTGANTTTISVSPSSNTNYTLTGTGSNACVKSVTKTVTVNPNLILTPTSASICIGSSIALIASGATTYSWSTGATTASISVSPTTATTYTVRGTSGSCSKTLSTTVYPASIPNTTVSTTSSSVCLGNSATLTASGATTYSWNTGATTTTIVVTPTVTTTYTLRGTTNGCAKTVSITITRVALPAVAIAPASPTVCSGSPIILTASGASTYTWNTGPTTTTISVSPTVTTNYTVTGTATTGCKNTSVKTVTVIANPTITITNPTPTICAGTAVLLTGNGATSYTWNTGPTTSTLLVSPIVSANYTITGRTNGCSKTATTSITAKPNPTVVISPTTPTICAGNAITLTASGASTYSWNTGALINTISVSPLTNSSYSATGTGTNGCAITVAKTVTVNNQITVSPSSQTICAGSSTTLTASGSTSYSWSTGATTSSIVITPSVNTTYTVRGTTGSCVRTVSTTIMVNPLPTLFISNPTPSVCFGGTAILTASGTAITYTWNTSAIATTISVTPIVTTIYTVTGSSSLGCTATATTTVYPVCPANYNGIGYKTKWKNFYGTFFRNDSLKVSGITLPEGYPVAISKNTLLPNTNGWAEQIVGSPIASNYAVGFCDSASAIAGNYFDIDFAIHVYINDLYVFHNGYINYLGTVAPGDVLRIERTGSNYNFKKNNTILFTDVAPATKCLKLKGVLNVDPIVNLGASFADSTGVYFANYVKPKIKIIHTNDGTPYGTSINDGGVNLYPSLGESGYTYTWSPGATNGSSISNKSIGSYTVLVKDGLQNSSVYNYDISYKTKWTGLEGMEFRNDSLISLPNSGLFWNTALSENKIVSNTNGFVRWKIRNITSSNVLGFLEMPSGDTGIIDDIRDGIFQSFNELYFITGGSFSFIGYCLPEDELKLSRIGSTLYFYRNSTLIFVGPASISIGADWKIKAAIPPPAYIIGEDVLIDIGTIWPAPFNCNSYNLQLLQPPIACKNNPTSFVAKLKLFTTTIAPSNQFSWNANPSQIGSTITNPSFFDTYNILNANANFVLTTNTTHNTCPVINTFNVSVSNLIVNAGPDYFLSSFPSAVLNGGNAPTAQGGMAPYSYNWLIPPGLTTNPSTLNSLTSNFTINPISPFGLLPYSINLAVTDALNCVINDSFNIYDLTALANQKHYSILNRKFDAGYYNSVTSAGIKYFYFKFDEEYYNPNNTNLTYKVFNDNGGLEVSLPNLIQVIGDNRFALNVNSLNVGWYYKIFVYNQKNEVWEGRIKIN
jgi:hypothetical protein